MGMRIDEAGKAGFIREVGDICARRNLISRLHAGDFVACDFDDNVLAEGAAGAVEERSTSQVLGSGLGDGSGAESECGEQNCSANTSDHCGEDITMISLEQEGRPLS